jgi:hypothetical protein
MWEAIEKETLAVQCALESHKNCALLHPFIDQSVDDCRHAHFVVAWAVVDNGSLKHSCNNSFR